MDSVADDLQEPDETRPAKRVRLEAPLGMTEEVEEEMIDDEDLYGTPADSTGVDVRDVIGEPDLKAGAGEDRAHELPNSITMAETGVQADVHGFGTPQPDDDDSEDLYGEGSAETAEGLPAEAVDNGEEEFVAPPRHVNGEDGVEEAIIEETSRMEAEPPVESQTTTNGEHQASTDVIEQQKGVIPSQQTDETVAAEASKEHIAPSRSRLADDEHSGDEGEADIGDEDFYDNLETGLVATGPEETSETGDAKSSMIKPQDDPEFLQAAAAQKDNESAEWQFDSSDAEPSSSESDSSDSDSDSESGSGSEDGYEMLDPATAAKILMSGDGEDDEGKEKSYSRGGPRTTNEVKDETVPKPNITVTEDMKITLLGTVDRVVENMALIQGATPGEYQVLESGSVLCNASREVIGAVAETFGKVQAPMYSVAFKDANEIEDMGLKFGAQVFYVDSHSNFVFTQPLKGMKGTDASNIHDEEVGEDEIEFSDDEKEAEYKRMKKAAKRGGRGGLTRTDFNSDRGGLRTFGAPGHDSGRTFIGSGASDAPQTTYGGGMSYDEGDAQDDFYQPLKRPDNLSELMAGAPPPPPSNRGGFDRGRGGGRGRSDRGRGDRGRGERGRGERGRGRGGFNQRGQHHSADAPRGGHGQNGQRGGRGQANGHHGPAHSFPDRHNSNARGKGQRTAHNIPTKPHGQQSPTPPQSSPQQQYQQYPPFPPAQPQQHSYVPPSPQQTYQFNGYTFQYGQARPPPSPAQYQQPQQQYFQNQGYQQHSPTQQQSPGAQIPAGAYVNPAFWDGQQQQQQPQPQVQKYGGWNAQAQQPQQYYAQPQAQAQGQQQNLADILRVLGGQGQGQR